MWRYSNLIIMSIFNTIFCWSACSNFNEVHCQTFEFQRDRECVHTTFLCDGINDCSSGYDENVAVFGCTSKSQQGL